MAGRAGTRAAERLQAATSASKQEEDLDSVDLEFGKEYSDDTLAVVRDVPKPDYLKTSDSLDEYDYFQEVEYGVNVPPQAYDALQELGQAELQQLQAAIEHKPNPQETAAVRYRQSLAEGTKHEDMTWLKLRAYHRAMAELQAEQDAQEAQQQQQLLQAYEVPVDRVPADLLNLNPAQLAERRKLSLLASSKAAKLAEQRKSAIQRILSQPDPSEESEWEQPTAVQPQQPPASLLLGVQQAFQQYTGQLQLLPATSPQQEPQPQVTTSNAFQVLPLDRPVQPKQRRVIYTQAYQEQQALQAQLRKQAQQRKAAFWLSFLTVSGAYIIRMMRRRMLKKPSTKPPAAKPPAAKPYVVQTRTLASELEALHRSQAAS